jgi:hypothetical protein
MLGSYKNLMKLIKTYINDIYEGDLFCSFPDYNGMISLGEFDDESCYTRFDEAHAEMKFFDIYM